MSLLLSDRYGRRVDYLRISLIENCNFKCVYCMPPEGTFCSPSAELLSPEEIERFVRGCARLGITRVRLTGGEPTLRRDLVEIVERLSRVDGIQDLSMTTNGSRLSHLAKDLKKSGLKRINVSLDSLNPQTFFNMAQASKLDLVLEGLEACFASQLPVKLNAVIMKGINSEEIDDFINYGFEHPIEEIRIIEFMPLCGSAWKPEYVLPFPQIIADLKSRYVMKKIIPKWGDVSESYTLQNGSRSTRVGFINTLSKPFCNTCSRMRLTSTGEIKPCLFSDLSFSVRDYLVSDCQSEQLLKVIQNAVLNKPRGNDFNEAYEKGITIEHYLNQGPDWNDRPSIRAIGG